MTNAFSRLLRLLPQTPLLVGTVIGYADGVATLQLLGGGVTTARGEATVGDKVFFRDSVIEGPAPDLPEDSITV